MNYLEKNVMSRSEAVKIAPKKNSLFLVIKWIWGVLGCWLLLIPTFDAIKETVRYKTTEYLVTDQKVMEKYGWISTHTDEMPLAKIENVVVKYTFWGKIFNYGTLICQGTNNNDIVFSNIKNAESVKKRLNELI
jgi:uncharacterized membrane protein YdbT with pleckstrin-like domain